MSQQQTGHRKLTDGLNVAIVGGSITACATATLLSRAGAVVSVFERSSGNLEDRGVGLAMKISTLEALAERALIDADMPHVPVWHRTFARAHDGPSPDGTPWQVYWEQPVAFRANHWGVLFRSLRQRVPDEIYYQGHEVTGFEEQPNGSIDLQFANQPARNFDLVIFADGYESVGRRILRPDCSTEANRYFLWRGMIDEWVLPMPERYADTITYFGYEFGHGFVYYVPSPDPEHGSTPGKRRLNWAFHETVAGKTIPGIKSDEDGYVRQGLRPGAASDAQIAYCRAMAREYFPPFFGDVVAATDQPFIQPVVDACVPSYTQGRVCLIGDAATLTRPHIGGGAGKALDDALALADLLATRDTLDGALAAWDETRSAFGSELFDVGRSMGEHLVEATPDWDSMDHVSMERWWQGVIGDRYWFWVAEVADKHPLFNA
ncbi:MAG: FAD-dependent monooxygenase [Alphaproteobacteria bacterium]|nr:FAD-dependent monooxygenase [Alphaproteobacteria bacterium]